MWYLSPCLSYESTDVRVARMGCASITEVKKGVGNVMLNTQIENLSGRNRRLIVRQKVWNKNHEVVAQGSKALNVVAPVTMVSQQMRVQKPKFVVAFFSLSLHCYNRSS